jgi:hypothetical protein
MTLRSVASCTSSAIGNITRFAHIPLHFLQRRGIYATGKPCRSALQQLSSKLKVFSSDYLYRKSVLSFRLLFEKGCGWG